MKKTKKVNIGTLRFKVKEFTLNQKEVNEYLYTCKYDKDVTSIDMVKENVLLEVRQVLKKDNNTLIVFKDKEVVGIL